MIRITAFGSFYDRKMIKLIFFDLDNTLAPVGMPIPGDCLEKLNELYRKVKTAVCSGKPVSYLNGFARQAGLPDLIMCGENGLTYQFGSDLPPALSGHFPVEKEILASLEDVKNGFSAHFEGKYWCQKNEYAFTPFPFDETDFPPMTEYLKEKVKGTGLKVYYQPDCFDVLPDGIDKGSALVNVCTILGIDVGDTVTVGDHVNDYPMFERSGISVGISLPDKSRAKINVSSLGEAIDVINKLL